MKRMLKKWYLFNGFYTFAAIWTPVLWFISSARERYEMPTFDLTRMHWLEILFFIFLCVATLSAQGFLYMTDKCMTAQDESA